MTRKLMVLGLAAVLVVALAIPVVAQDRVVEPKLQKISKRALKQSRKAMKKSRTALRTARRATWQANAAAETARGAAGVARAATGASGAVAAELARTRVVSAAAGGGATTGEGTFVPLAGGPAVTVEVPASGLIEVWAQATIDGDGAVSLFQDGRPLGGQAELCSPDEGTGVLFSVPNAGEPLTVATPAGAGAVCGSVGAPGPVLFQTTPGTHTYELRYASCGCEDAAEPVTFSDRRLHVAPRL